MNMLAEALEIIVESESFSRVYNDIKQAIINSDAGVETGGGATEKWLAGMLASRGASDGKLNRSIQMLRSGQLEPETKEYRDAIRAKAAFEALYAAGWVNQDENGRYTFPSSRGQNSGPKLAKLSKFREFLSGGFNADKVAADPEKSFRQDRDAAVSDVIASMPPEQQQFATLFSSLTLSSYNLLVNLYNKRGPKDVANFRDTVGTAGFKDSADLHLLRKLGFVNEKNLLNRGFLAKFGAFMKNTSEPALMALNKEVSGIVKKSQHSSQLAANAAGKGNGPDDEAYVPDDSQFADDMNPDEDRAINSRIRDIEGGTKTSSKNDRAGGYQKKFSSMFKPNFS